MTTDLQTADATLNAALQESTRVEAAVARATLRAMCLAVRDEHPEVATIVLDYSDQGDWLMIDYLLDPARPGEEIEYDDYRPYAWHLLGAYESAWCDYVEETNRGRRLVHIDQVLAQIERFEQGFCSPEAERLDDATAVEAISTALDPLRLYSRYSPGTRVEVEMTTASRTQLARLLWRRLQPVLRAGAGRTSTARSDLDRDEREAARS